MERPTGVTILAVLEFIGAGFLILLGLLLLVGMGMLGAMGGGGEGGRFLGVLGALGAAAGVVVIIVAALPLAIGIGLWKLKNWARILVIIFATIGALGNTARVIFGLSSGEMFNVVGGIVGLGIQALILWYMFQPHVKQAFGAG